MNSEMREERAIRRKDVSGHRRVAAGWLLRYRWYFLVVGGSIVFPTIAAATTLAPYLPEWVLPAAGLLGTISSLYLTKLNRKVIELYRQAYSELSNIGQRYERKLGGVTLEDVQKCCERWDRILADANTSNSLPSPSPAT